MELEYSDFLNTKDVAHKPSGFSLDVADINSMLFDWQKVCVRWALQRGRAGIFADCGLGKTAMQMEWAHQVSIVSDAPSLILAPLAVSRQTAREGEKFGIPVNICRTHDDVKSGVNITNYQMLEHFKTSEFAAVVVDEASIMKSYTGSFRNEIIEAFQTTPYKLACTATPSPNDYMELGNYPEFLGIMTRAEMLAKFFTHDGGETSKWRLKGHAEDIFWKWVASWALVIRKPSDIGYSDEGYDLPPLNIINHVIEHDHEPGEGGSLIAVEARSLTERRSAKRISLRDRVAKCAELVNGSNDQWIIWCSLNDESAAIAKAISGCVEVTGSDTTEFKEQCVEDFVSGKIRYMVSKGSIFGFGMNFQNCHNTIELLTDSWESHYQIVRRCYRFGQRHAVNCHIVTASTEGNVVKNIQRKEHQAITMSEAMVEHMKTTMIEEIQSASQEKDTYKTDAQYGKSWTLLLGDCVEQIKTIESETIGYTIFSPPFDSLYTYSASNRDMGNNTNPGEFAAHFSFLIPELYRVTMPGRLLSFHCMNLPHSKERDGFIGIRDFRGELIRAFIDAGWIFHSEVVIWKDPVTAMQRTKALGLLHKTIRKDSAMSRQGIPDYLITMRKPGTNPVPISHTPEEFPVSLWQRYASPVWMDINPSNTLQKSEAREDKDERHICPLQLEVIERGINLWSAPNDLVLTPFAGIGSECYTAVKLGRRAIGIELKPSYFDVAVANLQFVEQDISTASLFDFDEPESVAA